VFGPQLEICASFVLSELGRILVVVCCQLEVVAHLAFGGGGTKILLDYFVSDDRTSSFLIPHVTG
jgi:hypothetical protein